MESGMLDDFIDRKHGRKEISYFYDEFEEPLKPILEPTYGVIVYQEQVMQIVQVIGGFSLGGADLVRRAMGKKIKEEMDRLKGEFADGAVKKGYNRAHAEELFDLIVKFAGYGFNKSHSAAYAMVTFQTSYLKAYYPTEFMAALLTSEQDNTDKVVKYIDELKKLKIELVSPDINISELEFSASHNHGGNEVYFGMGAVKGSGNVAINSILKARAEGEKFKDMGDFISRIDSTKVNKKVIESLAKAGAFDSFGLSRRSIIEQIDIILETSAKARQAKEMAVNSLFGDSDELTKIDLHLEPMSEYTQKQILEFEKETLGIYVSGHPLDEYREQIDQVKSTSILDLKESKDGQQHLIVGKIENITRKTSKSGNAYGRVRIMDFYSDIELMLFSKFLDQLDEFNIEEPIAIKVQVSRDESNFDIRVQELLKVEDAKEVKLRKYSKKRPPKEQAIPMPEPIQYEDVFIYFDIKSDPCLLDSINEMSTRGGKGTKKITLIMEDQEKHKKYVIDTQLIIDEDSLTKIKTLKDIKIA
jgi:DNA polymerase-3 subunit alpha